MTAEVAALACEQAVIFTSFHQSPLPTAVRMAGVPHISALSVDYPGALLDIRHTVPDDVPEVQRALSLTSPAGFSAPDDDRLAVRRPLPPPPAGGQRDDLVVCHVTEFNRLFWDTGRTAPFSSTASTTSPARSTPHGSFTPVEASGPPPRRLVTQLCAAG